MTAGVSSRVFFFFFYILNSVEAALRNQTLLASLLSFLITIDHFSLTG